VSDMNPRTGLAQRARMIRALAHPSRLLILDELLRNGERCVCEITQAVGAEISTVSRHLAVLRSAGLVADEKRGLKVFYRLKCPEAGDLIRATELAAGAIGRELARTYAHAVPGES